MAGNNNKKDEEKTSCCSSSANGELPSSMAARFTSSNFDYHHHQTSSLTPAELQKYLAYTLVMCRKFREQPLLSCDAQVFVLDAKRNWEELSSHPVPVHIYFDSTRQTYRLICVDVAKPLINSTITSSVVVTKTSKKFAQWIDRHANLVYGLGFLLESELDQFVSKVKELQQQQVQIHQTSSSNVGASSDVALERITSVIAQNNGESSSLDAAGGGGAAAKNAPSTAALNTSDTTNISSERNSSEERPQQQPQQQSSQHHVSPHREADLLKKENDKLKEALANSAVNVTQWKQKLDMLEKQNRTLRDVVFNDSKDNNNVMGASRRALNVSSENVPRSLSVDSAQREVITNTAAELDSDADALIAMASKIKELGEHNKYLSEKMGRIENQNKAYKSGITKTLGITSTLREKIEKMLADVTKLEESLMEMNSSIV